MLLLIFATKPIPQLSCSKEEEYKPLNNEANEKKKENNITVVYNDINEKLENVIEYINKLEYIEEEIIKIAKKTNLTKERLCTFNYN